MKAVSVAQIKKELQHCTSEELAELCLRLAKFKQENKEILTYLLLEAHDETGYITSVKAEVDAQFEQINTSSYYYMRKSVRKILKTIKKFARYSLKKETEVELLLHFCLQLKAFQPSIFDNVTLSNTYFRQLGLIKKTIEGLHEDLQYDYRQKLTELEY